LNVFINYFTSILNAFQKFQISVMIRIFALQRQITITLVLTFVGQDARKSSQLNLFDGTKALIPMKETRSFKS